jgi:uncharacterized protein (TIGR02466 family)
VTRVQPLFPTLIYSAPLLARGASAFNADLADECRKIRAFDRAGQRWSQQNYPGGYTSYGSMDRLHRFSSTFDQLRSRIDRHVAAFARALHWELKRGGKLEMTDCWINLMEHGAAHGSHLHPQAVISGTYYVQVPSDSPGLKFEDPRLSRMMAAPSRKSSAPIGQRAHVTHRARVGQVVLFESWLRHEVPSHRARGERISVSFNYHHA